MKIRIIIGILLLVVLTGCSGSKKFEQAADEPNTSMELPTKDNSVPKRIVTFSPAIIDFIDYFDLDVEVMADTTFIPDVDVKNLKGVLNGTYLSYTDIRKIADFKPDIVFVTKSNKGILKDLSAFKTVDISVDMENYYNSFRDNIAHLGKIFKLEKNVNYELLRLNEMKQLVYDEAERRKEEIDVDKFFVDIMKLQIRYSKFKSEVGVTQNDDKNTTDANLALSSEEQYLLVEHIKEKSIPSSIGAYKARLEFHINKWRRAKDDKN